jgi:hypothetical protein
MWVRSPRTEVRGNDPCAEAAKRIRRWWGGFAFHALKCVATIRAPRWRRGIESLGSALS